MLLVDMRLLLFSVIAVRIIQSHISKIADRHCVEFSIIHEFSRIKFIMFKFKSGTIKHCIARCMMTKNCKSINFHFETTECEISEHTSTVGNMERKKGWTYMETIKMTSVQLRSNVKITITVFRFVKHLGMDANARTPLMEMYVIIPHV